MNALVVGVGRPDRRDDAAGLLVAAAVQRRTSLCDVVTVATPVRLLDAWSGRDRVVVVDAVRSGRRPGEITVADATARPLPTTWSGSGGSHAFGVGDALELARSLGRLPRHVLLVGIEAADTGPGCEPTAAVAAAVEGAADAVLAVVVSQSRGAG